MYCNRIVSEFLFRTAYIFLTKLLQKLIIGTMDIVEYVNGRDYIPVVYTPADDYVPLALISMVSLLKNTNKNVDIVILYSLEAGNKLLLYCP